ncbi:LCP family protein [Alicyclobacillus sp. SO9]|uniref:LCP family protein n=1 Tax=Alicyclobacillus sp. SO9 TaxID=2665646 RepID=UPI0018E8943C|nr:LCP family protein [Alicyclobacillus sp. SO9]QQE78730.1 LCP family protein [Alicyclobacillus sp. SO9]
MAKKTAMEKGFKKRHRGLKYTLTVLGVLVGAGAGFGVYEYQALQPTTHFNNLKTIGGANSTGNTAGATKEKAGIFNMLLIGSDARPGQKVSHSDSMVLIHVNLNTHQYNMLSIPRDTRVYDPGYGYTKLTSVQYMDQVNHGTKHGIVRAVESISRLTGVPINYYAETNYWGLQDMVNAIGGINMTLPFNVKLTHAWYPQDQGKVFTKGTHFFKGRDVTEVVHERYSLPGTDYGRQRLQEEALIGIAKAILKPANVTKLPKLANTLPKFLIATNMTKSDIMSLALGVKGDFHPHQQIHYRQVKGKSEVLYNDILKAKDDEIVMNPGQLKSVVKNYFTN